MHTPNVTQSTDYKFIMSNDFMHTEFFVQTFSGLGMSFGQIDREFFGHTVKRPGDNITFNDLSLTVILDEELEVLEELYNTMAAKTRVVATSEITWTNLFEGILHLSTNRNNIRKRIRFENCWIKDIGDISYSAIDVEASIITTSVGIPFDSYTIEAIDE